MPTVGSPGVLGSPLPAGGFVGDTLTQQGGVPTWQRRTVGISGVPLYVSKNWYSNQTVASTAQGTSYAAPNGILNYIPMWLPRPVSISAMALQAAPTAANSTIVLGATFTDPTYRIPGDVIGFGQVTVASVSLAMQVVTFGSPMTLPTGWSFLIYGMVNGSTLTTYASSQLWAYRASKEHFYNQGAPQATPAQTGGNYYTFQATSTSGSPYSISGLTQVTLTTAPPVTMWFRVA